LPALNIPKNVRNGFAILRDIPDAVFNELLVEIERQAAPPSVKNLSTTDIEQLVDAITAMSAVRASAEVSVEQFAADICESLRELGELKPDQEPRFSERLSRLLDIETLKVTAKAFALYSEHEHLFCSARILTDARPIYIDDPSAPPMAMIITHTLKIDYHGAGGRLHEIYIGMGSNDIDEIRDVLDRAEKKAKSLRAAFDANKIRFIDPQHE
jgi:hypothetical protein